MVKKLNKDHILKESLASLSDEDLRFICSRLSNRLNGDTGEVVEYLQTIPSIDELLLSVQSCHGFYDMLELMFEYADREIRRRSFDKSGE